MDNINGIENFMCEKDIAIFRLRRRRDKKCFSVINRGKIWYDTLTDNQIAELKLWYQAWLKVTDTMVEPTMPSWLN